jgi:pSer/pThr/pTyr-binding forkhead associated (FHA) protein
MNDGRTRKLELHEMSRMGRKAGFLDKHQAALVVATGPHGGTEHRLEKDCVTLGRGPGVDVLLDDASVSHQHAALELVSAGYRIRDLGSTNGVRVNGVSVAAADLEHGDRLEVGAVAFRYVVEARTAHPPIHHVDED